MEICSISTSESGDSKVNFVFSRTSSESLRDVFTGPCRASFALSFSAGWIYTASKATKIQAVFCIDKLSLRGYKEKKVLTVKPKRRLADRKDIQQIRPSQRGYEQVDFLWEKSMSCQNDSRPHLQGSIFPNISIYISQYNYTTCLVLIN